MGGELKRCMLFFFILIVGNGCDVTSSSSGTVGFANTAKASPTVEATSIPSNTSDGSVLGTESEVNSKIEPSAPKIPGLRKVRCAVAKTAVDRRLCKAVMSEADKEDEPTYQAFEVTARDLDLDKDGHEETVAWISSWGGTGGQSFFVLAETPTNYRKLFEDDSSWTPIIVLQSESNGWRDLAFLVTGGGVDTHYAIVKHNGSAYQVSEELEEQPDGEILIDKNWDQSYFGPLPKSEHTKH